MVTTHNIMKKNIEVFQFRGIRILISIRAINKSRHANLIPLCVAKMFVSSTFSITSLCASPLVAQRHL